MIIVKSYILRTLETADVALEIKSSLKIVVNGKWFLPNVNV